MPRCPTSTGRPTRSEASPFARVTSSPAGAGNGKWERDTKLQQWTHDRVPG